MKNRDEKMRLRHQEKEEERLLRMVKKQERMECRMKEEGYNHTDKDRQEREMFRQLEKLYRILEG